MACINLLKCFEDNVCNHCVNNKTEKCSKNVILEFEDNFNHAKCIDYEPVKSIFERRCNCDERKKETQKVF